MQTHPLIKILFQCSLALMLTCCAAKTDIKQPAGTHISAGPETVAIQPKQDPGPTIEHIEIKTAPQSCSVNLLTNIISPAYTVFKLSNPARIIIDLQDMDIAPSKKLLAVHNDFIKIIKAIKIEDTGEHFLRIEIGLQNDVAYNARHTNNTIHLDLRPARISEPLSPKQSAIKKPASKPQAQKQQKPGPVKPTIKTVTVDETASGCAITIAANTSLKNYSTYTLQNPNRLAIDIPAAKSLLRRPVRPATPAVVKTIRSAQKADHVRIVIDFAGKKFPLYQISQNKHDITINVTAEPKTLAKAKPQKNKAAPVPATDSPKESTEAAEIDVMKKFTGEKISLDFKDADIKNVLRLIADISNTNMIVSDNVQGKVTMKLEGIPWDEALDIILETNNAGQIATGNVVRIETRDQIRKINEEKLQAKKSQENIEDLVVKTVDISYAKASDLASFLKKMKVLSPRGSVTEFELTNKLTIQDIPANVEKSLKLVAEQDIPTRQVLIEARIVQSIPSYVKEFGINWGGNYATTHNGDAVNLGGALAGNSVVGLPSAANGAINFGFIKDSLNLDVQLTALENEDKLKIVSNPRILSLDNKEARIKQGVALPFLKLSEEGVTSTEFKDAVLELEVTPKITPSNTIALHVYITKNQKSAQTGAGNEPGIDVREVETDLLIESGKTIVIGGIYETQKSKNIKKVPFFGDMPIIGRAFRSEKEEDLLTELLIFMTVTVVEQPQNIARTSELSGVN